MTGSKGRFRRLIAGSKDRFRRLIEWLWRGQQLRELQQKRWGAPQRQALNEAEACHAIAGRSLAGLEPISAASRAAVATPLLVAGIDKCLPLLNPPSHDLLALLDDTTWQERFANAGVSTQAQSSLRSWPQDANSANDATRLLGVLLETLEDARLAIRRLYWRRLRVLALAFALVAAIATGLVLVLAPPEKPDLGVGKPWQSSSFYPGFPGSGTKVANPPEVAFFSTNDDVSPWWKIDLQKPTMIGSVTIVNRTDCCPDRAVPLAVEISSDGENWHEVARRTETFRTWSPSFKPIQGRYLRLRGLRRTFIHFKDVRIHAP